MNGIGELNEQHLHRALKDYYAGADGRLEVELQGYVVDVVREDGLVEIQTGNFASINGKLAALVPNYPLRLVYTIPVEKWLLKYPQEGGGGAPVRRKSPRRGRPVDVFDELVRFPYLLKLPNFTLNLILIHEEEVRWPAEGRAWRKWPAFCRMSYRQPSPAPTWRKDSLFPGAWRSGWSIVCGKWGLLSRWGN